MTKFSVFAMTYKWEFVPWPREHENINAIKVLGWVEVGLVLCRANTRI